MDNKKVAKYALSFIGGIPKVSEYYNDEKTKKIDIMSCSSDEWLDNVTYATIGLSGTDIGRVAENTDLRVELLMAGLAKNEVYGNILASTAFVIQEAKECDFGMVIEDVVVAYTENSQLRHVILFHPVFWPMYKVLIEETITVAWLMAVPITENERQFIHSEGIDAFDRLLEEKNVDISDLYRNSCV